MAMVTEHWTATMAVQATRTSRVRASVGVDMRTPTQIATAQRIVMMGVRLIAACRALTQTAAALELGAQERVVPDVGM